MPDASAVPAGGASASAAQPQISLDGGQSIVPLPGDAGGAPDSGAQPGGDGGATPAAGEGAQHEERISIDFGDGDKFTEEPEAPAARENADAYDPSKPLNPKIEELLKADPEALREAKRAHYENRDWRKLAKSPAALKEQLQRVEALGGLDHVEQEAGEWATVWAGFQAGDPKVLDEWFAGNAEGMSKLMPVALEKFYQVDRAGWDRYMSSVVMNTLLLNDGQGQNFIGALSRLHDLVGDNAEAKRILDGLANRINALDTASRRQAAPAGDKSLDERARSLGQQEFNVYKTQVSLKTNPLAGKAATQALNVLFKGRTVAADVRGEIHTDVLNATFGAMREDAQYQKDAGDLLRAQETDRFLRLYKSKLAKVLPLAARRVVRKYMGLSGNRQQIAAEGRTRVEAPAGAGSGQVRVKYTGKMVQGGPDPSTIDWARMRSEKGGRDGASEMFQGHQFYIKGDKRLFFF